MERLVFEEKKDFLAKLEDLVKSGTPRHRIDVRMPYPVHEADHLLDTSQSHVRFFTGIGAITGLIGGYAFTSYTVFSWPLITGGKQLISVPAFTVIAYEMTILFGCLSAFAGFLFLARMPALKNILSADEEFSNKFEIHIKDGK